MTYALNGAPVETGGKEDRLLPWDRVQDIAGISRTTAWRMQQTGAFPSPVTVSPGRVGWWESELTAWKKTRGAAPAISPPGKPGGRPGKTLAPPTEPRLPGMPRCAPVPSRARSAAGATQPELPIGQSIEPLAPKAPRQRHRSADASQIDFGF